MYHEEYVTMTELGRHFGVSRVVIGRTLREVGLRDRDGHPSMLAFLDELVEEREGREEWIKFFAWHKTKTIPHLEKAGLQRDDLATAG